MVRSSRTTRVPPRHLLPPPQRPQHPPVAPLAAAPVVPLTGTVPALAAPAFFPPAGGALPGPAPAVLPVGAGAGALPGPVAAGAPSYAGLAAVAGPIMAGK